MALPNAQPRVLETLSAYQQGGEAMSNHASEGATTRLTDSAARSVQEGRLDRERAASMAEEGGASAAIMETRDELATLKRDFERQRVWRTRWLWGAVALGCALFAGTLVLRSTRS
jgi:hypothetical protein